MNTTPEKENHIPNDETIAAFKEIENGGGCTFEGTIEEFFEELLKDDDLPVFDPHSDPHSDPH